VKPRYTPLFSSIRHSEKLAELPDDTCRLFYLMLLAQLDAWGRCAARPKVLFAEVWPLLGHDATETERCRDECARVGLIEIRELEGRMWIQLPDWEDKAGTLGKRDHRQESVWPDDGPAWPGLARVGPDRPAMARTGPDWPSRARASEIEIEIEREIETKRTSYAPATSAAGARADASSELFPAPNEPAALEVEAVPDDGEPPGKARRRARVGGGTPLTAHWDAEWTRTGRPLAFAWTKADAIALAECAKLPESSPEEVCRRITRLLESRDPWQMANATPRLVRSQWNRLGVSVLSRDQAAIQDMLRGVAEAAASKGGAA